MKLFLAVLISILALSTQAATFPSRWTTNADGTVIDGSIVTNAVGLYLQVTNAEGSNALVLDPLKASQLYWDDALDQFTFLGFSVLSNGLTVSSNFALQNGGALVQFTNVVTTVPPETNNYFAISNAQFMGGAALLTNLPPYGVGQVKAQMPVPGLLFTTFQSSLGCNANEALVTNTINQLKTNGMLAAGYNVIMIEDGQHLAALDANGLLQQDFTKYPDAFPIITDFAHTNGFRIGSYLSYGGPHCSAPSPPLLYAAHLNQLLGWNFDGLTIDQTASIFTIDQKRQMIRIANQVGWDNNSTEPPSTNKRRGFFILINSNDGSNGLVPWEEFYGVNVIGGGPTVTFPFDSQAHIMANFREAMSHLTNRPYGPGVFNILTGFGQPGSTLDLAYQMFAAHTICLAPVQYGIVPGLVQIPAYLNRDILDMLQDPACIPGYLAFSNSLNTVWVRQLGSTNSGSNCVWIVNENGSQQTINVSLTNFAGVNPLGTYQIYDVTNHTVVSNFTANFNYVVPANAHKLIKIYPAPQSIAAPGLVIFPPQTNILSVSNMIPSSTMWFNSNSITANQNYLYVQTVSPDGTYMLPAVPVIKLPTTFIPQQVANPKFICDIGSMRMRVGDMMTTWLDSSGNGLNAVNADNIDGPIYTNNPGVINGKGFASFNKVVMQGMKVNGIGTINQPFTIFIVMRYPTANGIIFEDNAVGNALFFDTSQPGGLFFTAGNQNSFNTTPGSWGVLELSVNGASTVIKTNGVTSIAYNSGAGTLSTALWIGCNNAGIQNSPFDCAFFGLWTGTMAAGDETGMLNYLTKEYGIAGGSANSVTNGGVSLVGDGSGITNLSSVILKSYLAADATSTSVSLANTLISVNVVNGHKYIFDAELFLSDSTAADGAVVDFAGGGATATNFRAQITAFDTALNFSTVTTTLAGTGSATTFTGNGAFEVHGSFEPSSSGTFIVRFAQKTHSVGTLTIARGSNLVMHDASQ